jgi:hypothetical protein
LSRKAGASARLTTKTRTPNTGKVDLPSRLKEKFFEKRMLVRTAYPANRTLKIIPL